MFGRILSNTNAWLNMPPRRLLVDRAFEGELFVNFLTSDVPSRLSFIRGPVNGNAWASDGAGVFQEYGANIPRFDHLPTSPFTRLGLLMEGQRTNSLRNPRAEYTVTPTFPTATPPTTWGGTATTSGITRQFAGAGIEDGIPYIDVRIFGTATATSSSNFVLFEGTTQIVASLGQTWTCGVYARVVAGSFTGFTAFSLTIAERDSGGGQLATGAVSMLGVTGSPLASQRITNTRTLSNAAVARMTPVIAANFTNGAALDVTVRIGLPSAELAPFASTPIAPPVGTAAVTTRAADLLLSDLSNFATMSAVTVVASFTIPQNAPTGSDQNLFQIDDGTDNNRVRVRNVAGGATIVAGRVNAGAPTDATTLGSMTAGTRFAVGLSLDSAGNIIATYNGGAVQTLSGAPAGLLTLRFAKDATGANSLFGRIVNIRVLPTSTNAANLQALTTAALT